MNYPGKEVLTYNISGSDYHEKEILEAAARRAELETTRSQPTVVEVELGGEALAGTVEVKPSAAEQPPKQLAA